MEMVWTACDAPAATAEDTTPPEGLDAGDPSSAPSSSVVDTFMLRTMKCINYMK